MTRQRVTRQQNNVRHQNERSNSDAKLLPACRGKPKCGDGVVPQDDEKNYRNVKKVTMQVLDDERKARLANVAMRVRLADGACRRIKEESAIVSFPVVIASGSKTEWRP